MTGFEEKYVKAARRRRRKDCSDTKATVKLQELDAPSSTFILNVCFCVHQLSNMMLVVEKTLDQKLAVPSS
ncbi:hypothetical protein EPR50_G00175050 [Perca flavescens]|uniref:Uncharacterized protein n=1 Tax=Perca flavescens TaxID=8167 RepID=A0A484CBW6_PERFV|nr:hypothetical protein EPR50_G00175050 [Perca flavescens]